jgi:ClpP class serine protease
VVSWFGDVAASGGYYLAAGTPIVARPASLTGSIGVFGGKLALGGLARRLGITAQPVTAGEGALWDRPFRRFSEAERERFKQMLTATYDAFVRRVAAGRGVAIEQIEPHCQGRTWSGTSAARVGLVEQLGGLDDAVALALTRANVAADRVWREHISLHPRPWWVTLARSFVGLQAGVPSSLSAWVEAALAGRPGRRTRDAAVRAAAALEQLHEPPAALALWTWLRAPR